MLKDAPARFSEHLDIIQKGLRERIFSHSGPHLTIPPTAISVRTVQKPTPPIWLAAGSAWSMRRAFREGHNLFVTVLHSGLETIASLRRTIEEAAAAENRKPEDTKVGFLRCAFASDNEAEIRAYLENARYSRRLSESLQQRRQQSDDGYLLKEQPSPNDQPFEALRANLPIGSVNCVIDRLLEEIEILKPNHIAIQTQLGNLDQTMMLRQIDLWGATIIPAVRRALGSDALSRVAFTARAAA